LYNAVFQQDVTAAIKKFTRRHGKDHRPPETLKALDRLQLKQVTIAQALKTETGSSVKPYQVSEWLRGTASCPAKYHDGLQRILTEAIKVTRKSLKDAEKSGFYPLVALEHYWDRVREAEHVLRAANTIQRRLVS
jgi:hypothetical protein